MKKTALLAVCLLGMLIPVARAQEPLMKDIFIDMPDSLMPMLSQNARKDLIDFYESGMRAILENEWGSRSQITSMTDRYLSLNEDAEGKVNTSMALMKRGGENLVCMVRTLRLPQPDSELMVYTHDWRELPALAQLNAFTDEDMGTAAFDYTEITIQVSDDGQVELTLTLDATDGMPDNKPDQCKTARYRWDGSRFTKLQ